MYSLVLMLHVLAGISALVTGAAAIAASKGSRGHATSGTIFCYSLYTVACSAVVMCLMKWNPFLLAIGLFSAYLTYSGQQAIRVWKGTLSIGGKGTRAVLIGAILVAAWMVLSPMFDMYRSGQVTVPVLSIFGAAMAAFACNDLRAWTGRGQIHRHSWLFRHISMMGGAYIATVTAFVVVNIRMEPWWVPWLAPSAAGTVLITLANLRWRRKLAGKGSKMLVLMMLVTTPAAIAQQVKAVSGRVIDEQQKPVPYASIGIVGSPVGTVADADGHFTIYLPKQYLEDTLTASCIGHESMKVPVSQLAGEKTVIVLHQKSFSLAETVVNPKHTKVVTVGNARENTLIMNNFAIGSLPGQNLGAEIGRRFAIRKRPALLKTVRFFVAGNNFDTVLIRVNVYSIKRGMPERNMLEKQIVVPVIRHRKGWVTQDLSAHDIWLSEHVIIGLEWIGHSLKGNVLYLPLSFPSFGSVHYYRFGSMNKWRRYYNMSSSINITLEHADE